MRSCYLSWRKHIPRIQSLCFSWSLITKIYFFALYSFSTKPVILMPDTSHVRESRRCWAKRNITLRWWWCMSKCVREGWWERQSPASTIHLDAPPASLFHATFRFHSYSTLGFEMFCWIYQPFESTIGWFLELETKRKEALVSRYLVFRLDGTLEKSQMPKETLDTWK